MFFVEIFSFKYTTQLHAISKQREEKSMLIKYPIWYIFDPNKTNIPTMVWLNLNNYKLLWVHVLEYGLKPSTEELKNKNLRLHFWNDRSRCTSKTLILKSDARGVIIIDWYIEINIGYRSLLKIAPD